MAGRSSSGGGGAPQAQALAEGQQVGEPVLAAAVGEAVLRARPPAPRGPEAVAVAAAVQHPALVRSERRRRRLHPCARVPSRFLDRWSIRAGRIMEWFYS